MTLSFFFMVLIVVAAGVGIWVFNGLVSGRNLCAAAWADVDVQLQRRHDLVPRLVKVVKAAAGHERETLEAVIAQRDEALRANAMEDRSAREQVLEQSLSQLIVRVEDYPDLKAGENFQQLTEELVDIEDKLQYARRFYNGATRDYNNRVERFPDQLIANSFGFNRGEFFQAEQDARAPAEVNL
ncbi:MAG: LemA family protein [Pseudomonadota bacterium]